MKISRILALFICMSAPTSLFAQIDPYKSLVIRDHKVLNEMNSSLDFGYLLGDVGNWTRDNFKDKLFDGARRWRPNWGAGHYVYYTLNDAALDQDNHTNAASIQKLGGAYNSDRTFRHILNTWGIPGKDGNNLNNLKNLMTPDSLRDLKDLNGKIIGSPFRLLAIVNRMDVAGDMDDRGTSHTTAFPRPLGEIHLIYGFVDKDYETKGIAYPATFVLAYRLPIIKLQGDVLVEETKGMENSTTPSATMDTLNQEFIKMIDHRSLDNRSAWNNQMSLWARLWQSLSSESIGSAQYNEKLRQILSLSIHPRNFLQLRSNFQVNEQEFELREWYIVQSTQALIKRKPRDEVYKCQSGQPELTRIVNYFWNNHYNDLDMTSRSLHDRALQGGRDGYTVPRDGGIPSENTSLLRTILTPFLNTTTGQLTQLTGCGDGSAVPPVPAPFEMVAAGNAAIPGNRIVYAPPFARVQRNDVWEIGVTANRERKRHAFAIRTCSGCHGQEAGAFGFHIAPRLELQNSRLSGFMTGVGTNKFIKNGVTYQYKELENRKNWLQKALDKNATLFDSLKRNDR